MKKPKDKRTKEYREWKSKQSKGVGDTVEKITKATGVKAVVEAFSKATGIDCGCDERKAKWNKKYPYKDAKCLLEDEYEFLDKIYKIKRLAGLNKTDNIRLHSIYNRVFSDSKLATSCAPCVESTLSELKVIYKEY